MRPGWLSLSRWSWFVVVGGLLVGKDACLGGGKRPEPRPAPSATPTQTSGFATPPPSQPPQPPPPG